MTVIALGMPSGLSAQKPVLRDAAMPTSGPMVDTFGRAVRDLRVSVTDRCNLRCTYCMPAEGLDWLARDKVLTAEEIVRAVSIGVRHLGVEAVRFTGGEPLLRKDLPDIIEAVAALDPRPEVALTTNGLGLKHQAKTLADAGLNRVNVSLDTVDAARFAAITRRDRLPDVLAGLEAAAAAGLFPVKVNAVLDTEHGLDDATALLRLCLDRGYELRIIEQMPLDAEHHWSRTTMITADQILERLQREFDLRPDTAPRGAAPAQRWTVEGYLGADGKPARVGVIASVTRPFCGDCDRTRLTADGQLRNCLFATDETDLAGLLKSTSSSDEEIALRWRESTWGKLPGHGVNEPGFLQPSRPMSAIGG